MVERWDADHDILRTCFSDLGFVSGLLGATTAITVWNAASVNQQRSASKTSGKIFYHGALILQFGRNLSTLGGQLASG